MSTKIEWTEETWNPITGCTKLGPECQYCYAERMAKRLKGRFGYPVENPFAPGTFHPAQMEKPFRWKKPRMAFVSSMGDLFHAAVADRHLDDVMDVITASPQHTFMLLTKRPARMRDYFRKRIADSGTIPMNMWLGVTVGINSPDSMSRLEILSDKVFQGRIRFVSVEPMLSAIDLSNHLTWLNWVICGAETGQKPRPCQVEWVRNLKDQCVAHNVPFFFKKFADKTTTIDGILWREMPGNQSGVDSR